MTTDTTARLLDFSQDGETYVQFLDSVVDTFYSTTDKIQVREPRVAPSVEGMRWSHQRRSTDGSSVADAVWRPDGRHTRAAA